MPLYIYALIDPDNGEARYVGKATIPASRLQGHVLDSCTPWAQENPDKAAWIRELAGRGKKPLCKILETVTEENWQERESYWMQHLRAAGARLTNRKPGGISRFATGGHKSIGIFFSAEQFNRLKQMADQRAVSISALVREMVAECLDRRDFCAIEASAT